MLRWTLVLSLAVVLLAGRAEASGSSRYRERSMKGWELYSWVEHGHWDFALLEGTNRSKSVAEVRAARADGGLDGVVGRIGGLERGDTVTWLTQPPGTTAPAGFALPADDAVARVKKACRRARVTLQLP